jgi:hypothetical protein
LAGFGANEAQVLLAPKQLEGTSEDWSALNSRLGGHGLALKLVAETIRELFGGKISSFRQDAGGSNVFGGAAVG